MNDSNMDLNGVCFTDAYTGTAVGSGGTILRTTSGGVTAVSGEVGGVPAEYVLLQNYPNPFNPSTAISYQLPAASHVRLTVYDLLGREVTTLVNEVKRPGSYTVEFDGSNLATGVYFCRLQAGDPSRGFTQTKRLLLLK
jgi:hypothetical protein